MSDRITIQGPTTGGNYYALHGPVFDPIAQDYARPLLTKNELTELRDAAHEAIRSPGVPNPEVTVNEGIVDALREAYDGGESLRAYLTERGVKYK